MDDRLEEILRRLEALERRVDAMSAQAAASAPDACPFRTEERRIVDLIVQLVGDRVDASRDHGERGYEPPPPPRPYEDEHYERGPRRGPPRR